MFKTVIEMIKSVAGSYKDANRGVAEDAGTHKFILVLSLLLILAPFLVQPMANPNDDGLAIGGAKLPPLCMSKYFLKVQCPGCGLSHSFVYVVRGRMREALRWHRAGILLYCFLVYQIIFRIQALRMPTFAGLPWVMKTQTFLLNAFVCIFAINWLVGLALGGNGS